VLLILKAAMVRIYYAANGARMSNGPQRKKVAGSMLEKRLMASVIVFPSRR